MSAIQKMLDRKAKPVLASNVDMPQGTNKSNIKQGQPKTQKITKKKVSKHNQAIKKSKGKVHISYQTDNAQPAKKIQPAKGQSMCTAQHAQIRHRHRYNHLQQRN